MLALDHLGEVHLHVIAQIIEAKLVVGAVCDVTIVGGLALLVVNVVDDDTDRQTQKIVDLAHPARVARGQIIVHRNDMDALARQRIQVNGKRRHKGLAFTGAHFGDLAFMEDHAADKLHVERAHAQHAF